MSVQEFCRGIKTNRVFAELEAAYVTTAGRSPAPAERRSWDGSLPRLTGALELAELPDSVYIGLEVPLPYYSNRIDAVLYGHDPNGSPSALLIELKQWSDVALDVDGRVSIRAGGQIRSHLHPSLQVEGYRRYLTNFVQACHNEPAIRIATCVYAHNYPARSGSLFDQRYSEALAQAPVFCATDAEQLAEYMRSHVGNDHGAEVYDRMRREGVGPSESLIARAAEMIRRQDVFVMLDEQIPAQKNIVRAIRKAGDRKQKSVILVDGGPGTGKSIIALNAVGEALKESKNTFLVSGSAAFTHGIRKLLGPDLAPLVKFTDAFWQQEENSIDVLIVDEAHRIREKSVPRVPIAQRPQIPQIEELIRAAKVTVLFMDAKQIIEPDECGDPDQVERAAVRLGAEFSRHQLSAQFRCGGSDEYVRWTDSLFGLTIPRIDQPTLRSPDTFDFEVFDSPHDILTWVQLKNAAEPKSARVMAGWCWPWSDPRSDQTLVDDIVIGDFTFPWELKNGKRGKPGIPEAKHWAIVDAGMDQAGTVYSAQGFEFRHVGLIMGPDLIVRNGDWVVNPRANFRKSIRAKAPAEALIYVKQIYRALFTRPRQSIRVYSVDAETRDFLRRNIVREYPTSV